MTGRSHNANILFQSEKHPLVPDDFNTLEEFCLSLIHKKAYFSAAEMARDKIVLDVGCNNGYGTKILSAHCKKVSGVDVSKRSIEKAKQKYLHDGIEFNLIDGKRLDFNPGTFDIVTSFQVIEHISDCVPYLSEIKRVLKAEGMAIFTTPNRKIRLDPGMKPLNPFHVREYSAETLSDLLTRYFPRVIVRGLFAEPYLYSIEYNRVQKAKERALRRSEIHKIAVSTIKTILPDVLMGKIRYVIGKHDAITTKDMLKYSTADFFYAEVNLDDALDLMAICYCDAANA